MAGIWPQTTLGSAEGSRPQPRSRRARRMGYGCARDR
jgi:hypothetical protein